MSIFVGKHALVAAFKELVDTVDTHVKSGATLATISAPTFSYLLTPKQSDAIKKVCAAEGWPVPTTKGIEIDVRYIAHVLSSRDYKDSVDADFVARILSAAFCDYGTIEINKKHGQQAIILNAIQKLPLNNSTFHGMAIFEIQGNQGGNVIMKPVTAYHANEQKIRKIRGK